MRLPDRKLRATKQLANMLCVLMLCVVLVHFVEDGARAESGIIVVKSIVAERSVMLLFSKHILIGNLTENDYNCPRPKAKTPSDRKRENNVRCQGSNTYCLHVACPSFFAGREKFAVIKYGKFHSRPGDSGLFDYLEAPQFAG